MEINVDPQREYFHFKKVQKGYFKCFNVSRVLKGEIARDQLFAVNDSDVENPATSAGREGKRQLQTP